MNTHGINVVMATLANHHYDNACTTNFMDPAPCPANYDYGHTAWYAFEQSRGNPDLQEEFTMRITLTHILLGTHPLCAHPDYEHICDQTKNAGFEGTPTEKGYPNEYHLQRGQSTLDPFFVATNSPTSDPTPQPTDPTEQPTAVPTSSEACWKYTNQFLDHRYKGAGETCRGGIDDEWPGAKTCESPYIVCLPDEHTPANPDPASMPNPGKLPNADLYTIKECGEECAFDQRCMGFEFRVQSGVSTGQCILIDDLEVIIEQPADWPAVGTTLGGVAVESAAHIEAGVPSYEVFSGQCCGTGSLEEYQQVSAQFCKDAAYRNRKANFFTTSLFNTCAICTACQDPIQFAGTPLFSSGNMTGRLLMGSPSNFDGAPSALCFAKDEYCNPFFEADDLNEDMLKCYCPNNRKGTYTKKVKRTIENTKYCEDVPAISERIRKAQANRMFHLCENWCLFETHNPLTESWYWDPWMKCWREQYAGTGMHRSYCNRVIRNPNTIEQMFINSRSDNFCRKDPSTNEVLQEITEEPTAQPSTFDVTWFLADEEESCDDACDKQSMTCDELTTNSIIGGSDPSVMNDALTQADPAIGACATQTEGPVGWALPALKTPEADKECILRNGATEFTGCNWPTGVGYRRLCACY